MRDKENTPWRGVAADVLLVSGGVLCAVGAGLIYLPAGLLAAGVLCLLGGWLAAKGGEKP